MGIFSNYCGLGGSGLPQHQIDALCKQHDEDYTEIIKKKGWRAAYLEYNDADKKFFERIGQILPKSKKEWITQKVSRAYFALKRIAAKHEQNKQEPLEATPIQNRYNLRKRPIEMEITPDATVKEISNITGERSDTKRLQKKRKFRQSGLDIQETNNVRRPLVWGKSFYNLLCQEEILKCLIV